MSSVVISGDTSGTATLTVAAVAGTPTLTLPTTTDTLVGRATTDTLTNKTLTSPVIATITNTGTLTLPTTTDTLVGKATTDTLTNKTFDTAGTGNVFKINGTSVTDKTGTGKAVLDTSPTIATPTIATIKAAATGAVPAIQDSTGAASGFFVRAWVNYNASTQTIKGSGNLSSMTYDATGQWRMNLTTAMPDTNYAVGGMGDATAPGQPAVIVENDVTARTTSQCRFYSVCTVGAYDPVNASLWLIR